MADPLLGATVSHYRILEQIGAGGMGIVYLAEDERLHRKVALKFITPASAKDTVAQQRLLREAQAASALDHPNIATVYEVGDFRDQIFIAMAYYEGETLNRRIGRGPLPVSEAASIAQHIAEGLEAAHAAGVVHRDLKPANVFLTTSGKVKILDFGLAKIDPSSTETTEVVTETGTTLGTLSYMAPEQALGKPVDQRADVWALGVLLFEMFTGRQPFTGESPAAIVLALATSTAPPLSALRPDAPAEFERLIEQALVKDPARRTLTASEAARTIAHYREQSSSPTIVLHQRSARRWWVALPFAAALVAAIGATAAVGNRLMNERRARNMLPEIEKLADNQDFMGAVALATEAQAILHDDASLKALWPRITRPVTIESEPAGATISIARYDTEPAWRTLGTTPLKDAALPLGLLRIKAEKAGYDSAEDLTFQGAGGAPVPSFTLSASGTSPEGMVRAKPAPTNFSVHVSGLSRPRTTFNGFWIDRYEITNYQYKAFVDAGGYKRREFWRHPFVRNGQDLSFDEVVALFRDATGRPGPATWELGSYPAGADALPVTGISWFEAAAYAAFAGNALPTVHHWYWVASQGLTGFVIPFGQYNAATPVPAAQTRSLHRFGAHGLAGNVKEWVFNEAADGRHYILGGGYDEPPYMFRDADARSPFDREPNFGFRTVKFDDGDTSLEALSGTLLPPSRSYVNEAPVSDQVFAAYRRMYAYDGGELASTVESVDDSNPDWRIEKVSFTAAYGDERVITYLLLPKRSRPPYQPIVFMPNTGAWDQRTSPSFVNPNFAFLLRSGRAVAFPIYKGTFERGTPDFNGSDEQKTRSRWRDYTVMASKDIGRTLDYLATRSDIDSEKVGFLGVSRGAAIAPMMLAVEPRIKTASLWIPGFNLEEHVPPEADQINFTSRVTIPVLQLSGHYDYNFPDETSSLPFFQALGTPSHLKRRVVYETSHNLPPNEAIRETIDWFDLHLGAPVEPEYPRP